MLFEDFFYVALLSDVRVEVIDNVVWVRGRGRLGSNSYKK